MIAKELNPPGRFDTWPQVRIDEVNATDISEDVGTSLVYQDVSIRVWKINLQPRERLPFHKHTCDYTWVSLTPGKAVSHYSDGKVVEITYARGDVNYYHHGVEGDFVHDLENVGDEALVFGTVEYKDRFESVKT